MSLPTSSGSAQRRQGTSSRQVAWWPVHEFVAPALERAGSWPTAGTPEWRALVRRFRPDRAEHLEAALALWRYAEHSARWLFSTYELEDEQDKARGLVDFIIGSDSKGRTRTEISRDHHKGHKSAAEISAELAPLIHDGVVIEVREDRPGGRSITRYVHRTPRICEFAKYAGQGVDQAADSANYVRTMFGDDQSDNDLNSPKFAHSSHGETSSDLHNSPNSQIRTDNGNGTPPGGLTPNSPGQTERVRAIVDRHRQPDSPHRPAPAAAPSAAATSTHKATNQTASK